MRRLDVGWTGSAGGRSISRQVKWARVEVCSDMATKDLFDGDRSIKHSPTRIEDRVCADGGERCAGDRRRGEHEGRIERGEPDHDHRARAVVHLEPDHERRSQRRETPLHGSNPPQAPTSARIRRQARRHVTRTPTAVRARI